LSGKEARSENRHDARLTVGILARAVHVREREGRELELVQLAVRSQVVVADLLRDAVRREGAL
jgi:hypothetical protein